MMMRTPASSNQIVWGRNFASKRHFFFPPFGKNTIVRFLLLRYILMRKTMEVAIFRQAVLEGRQNIA
jgi:hypothetical protein